MIDLEETFVLDAVVHAYNLDPSNYRDEQHAQGITSPSCMMVGYFIEQAQARVGALEGVEEVHLTTDAGMRWTDDMMAESAKRRRREHQRALAEQYEREQAAVATQQD